MTTQICSLYLRKVLKFMMIHKTTWKRMCKKLQWIVQKMKPPIAITHMSPLTIRIPMSWHVAMHFEFITKIKFPNVPFEVPTCKCAHTQVVLNMVTTIASKVAFTWFPSPNQQLPSIDTIATLPTTFKIINWQQRSDHPSSTSFHSCPSTPIFQIVWRILLLLEFIELLVGQTC